MGFPAEEPVGRLPDMEKLWSGFKHQRRIMKQSHRGILLFPEASAYDNCQHFLYARLKKNYAGHEEFTDYYHHLGTTFGPICERCESLEVLKVLIFMLCSSPLRRQGRQE